MAHVHRVPLRPPATHTVAFICAVSPYTRRGAIMQHRRRSSTMHLWCASAGDSATTATAPSSTDSQDAASSGSGGASSRVQERLDELTAKYSALNERLDSLENSLVGLFKKAKRRAASPAAAAAVGPMGEVQDGNAGTVSVKAEADPDALPGDDEEAELLAAADVGEMPEDDDEGEGLFDGGIFDFKKMQVTLTENINEGYLESVKRLRDALMAYEWHLHGKELAERKGVALFEHEIVERGMEVSYDAVSRLYEDPSALDVLPDERTRLLARSIIQQAVDERYVVIYREATATAKELAHTGLKDLIPDSAGKVGSVIADLLPVPGFLKK